jgi:hypothetical protein
MLKIFNTWLVSNYYQPSDCCIWVDQAKLYTQLDAWNDVWNDVQDHVQEKDAEPEPP